MESRTNSDSGFSTNQLWANKFTSPGYLLSHVRAKFYTKWIDKSLYVHLGVETSLRRPGLPVSCDEAGPPRGVVVGLVLVWLLITSTPARRRLG